MNRKIILLLIVVSVVLLNPSCVTKKKYLSMVAAKQLSDSTVLERDGVIAARDSRIANMIADFEQMKNELMESNAIKNQVIDSLSGVANKLAKDVSTKESTIGEKENSFEFERRQLIANLTEQKQLLSRKDVELNQLSSEFQKMKDELTQLTFDLNREKDEKRILQGNLSDNDSKITELTATGNKLKSDIQSLKKQLSDKNETITRLENNVKLLKKEIK